MKTQKSATAKIGSHIMVLADDQDTADKVAAALRSKVGQMTQQPITITAAKFARAACLELIVGDGTDDGFQRAINLARLALGLAPGTGTREEAEAIARDLLTANSSLR